MPKWNFLLQHNTVNNWHLGSSLNLPHMGLLVSTYLTIITQQWLLTKPDSTFIQSILWHLSALKQLNVGSHKQCHGIVQGLYPLVFWCQKQRRQMQVGYVKCGRRSWKLATDDAKHCQLSSVANLPHVRPAAVHHVGFVSNSWSLFNTQTPMTCGEQIKQGEFSWEQCNSSRSISDCTLYAGGCLVGDSTYSWQ